MLLALNIGNTNTGIAAYSDQEIVADWKIHTNAYRSADELMASITRLFKLTGLDPKDVFGVSFCSVVPASTSLLRDLLSKYWPGIPVCEVRADLPLEMKISYQTPQTLGADRICNAVAGFEKFGRTRKANTIVIDFGTATTYNVVTAGYEFIGGLIAPGIRTAAEGLLDRTAQLPEVDLVLPDQIIGKNTVDCIRSGIMYSAIAATDGIVTRLIAELPGETVVIATGGMAGFMTGASVVIQFSDPLLTFDGLKRIFDSACRPA